MFNPWLCVYLIFGFSGTVLSGFFTVDMDFLFRVWGPVTHTHSQVLRFGGQKYILGKQNFVYYMFKTIFSGHNTIWMQQKYLG